jgi:5'-nucleotidase
LPYELSDRLVVGVASSALFDLTESDAFFRAYGEAAYRQYQDERLDEALPPGVAFPFVKRLLGLNDLREESSLVEVIVLSQNDPNTGLRVMRSIRHHDLDISRAVFTQGQSPHRYIGELEMSLFLSADKLSVVEAIGSGFPAGQVIAGSAVYDEQDEAVRVAFDFDAVLAGDESEKFYRESDELSDYLDHEHELRNEPLTPGLFKPLLEDLNRIQELELARVASDPSYQPRLRISLVTARNSPAHERPIRSLESWGVRVNDAFFLGGIAKSKVLRVLKPHIFFDDQMTHLAESVQDIAGVHVPYGVANAAADPTVT